jgi:8-oxo-dGTP diphosphatase
MLEFGQRVPTQEYRRRVGSYAVILDGAGRVALMRTPKGLFLPGGGANPGETPDATLRREVREELGGEITAARLLGTAVEYVHACGEGYLAKECSFFHVDIGSCSEHGSEADHELVWVDSRVAMGRLMHRSQAWAVSQVLGQQA